MTDSSVWIFGYGSLCWRPGFEYEEMVPGHVEGWVRVFWQGNRVHRGTKEKPGRVATLVPTANGETYGCAFRICGTNAEKTLAYLEEREVKLGGYAARSTTFYPRDSSLAPVDTLVYIALPGNSDWRGPASLHDIVEEVISTSGECGPNADYVTELAAFLRSHELCDDHLFQLEEVLMDKL